MLRLILLLLLIAIPAWLGLHQCVKPSQRALVLKPAASFPKEKNTILGQTVARILPHCPGFQKFGAVLEFTDLTENGDAVTLHFSTPDSQAIPSEWNARGQQCVIQVDQDAFILDARAACQALCLGEPGIEGQHVRKALGNKKQ